MGAARTKGETECRRCATYCDRVIEPATCVAAQCSFLYAYDDPLSGRRFMGCLQGVFDAEIDVEMFGRAQRTPLGYGAVKLARPPLRRCSFRVEQAHHEGLESCTNRRFFDAPDAAPDALRAFDLRDGLDER